MPRRLSHARRDVRERKREMEATGAPNEESVKSDRVEEGPSDPDLDLVASLRGHPDYRVSGIAWAAWNRMQAGDRETGLLWMGFAVSHLSMESLS